MSTKNLILDGHKLLWHKDRVETWLAGEHGVISAVREALSFNSGGQ